MSRIGRKPVTVPNEAKAAISGSMVKISGPKGELSFELPSPISAEYAEDSRQISVSRKGEDRPARAKHGMARSVIANMVEGVTKGYERRLLIYGTGYGCNLAGNKLHLNCGFMGRGGKDKPQFIIEVPAGLDIKVEVAAARGDSEPAKLLIAGCDKQLVGQFAAEIRRIRPPEPYKGKGIRYDYEIVKKKAGKAFASGG